MENSLVIEFNKQINREFYSAYLYYAMSAYFSQANYDGLAKYMKKQAIEELEHAQKVYDFMLLRHSAIKFERIEEPDMLFGSPIDVFSKALEHEKFMTHEILKLNEKAKELKDSTSQVFLQDLIFEQAEEEDKFMKILDKITFNPDCACIVERLDAELK